jgi:hypothetical protein
MNTAPSNPTYKWNPNGKVTEKKPEAEVGTGYVNYCKSGMISECGVTNKIWKAQIECKFSIKASYSNRCMYNVMEEVCDCLKAQMAK